MGPNTARRYRAVLVSAGLLDGPLGDLPDVAAIRAAIDHALPPLERRPAPLEAWRSRIEALYAAGLSARATFDRLRIETLGEPAPLAGSSYSAVKRAYSQIRRERGVEPEDVVIPVESVLGEAQVDFGYAGLLYDPERGILRRAWAFVMILTHSRLMFVRLVFDQKTETWLDLHEQAFRAFDRVPTTVVPDNTRRAVMRAAFGIDGPAELERSYREFAQCYGFMIDPAPPGAPRKRGKAEAAVKYLRRNPLAGRHGHAIDEAQRALDRWNREIASTRVHGSTGRRPVDVFEKEERAAMRPLPERPTLRAMWKRATVHPDCHVTSRGRLFSVPWRLVHEVVWVRACGSTVEVFHRDQRVAVHADRGLRRTTIEEHLPEDRRDLRHRGRAFWEVRAHRIGPETFALVREVFKQDDVLSHLRQVQAIVRHLECFPPSRAEATARHVRVACDPSYQQVRATLLEGTDLRPVRRT